MRQLDHFSGMFKPFTFQDTNFNDIVGGVGLGRRALLEPKKEGNVGMGEG